MTFGEVGRLTDETIRLHLRLAETTALLMVAVQYACLDGWAEACRQATAALRDAAERQARTTRLISRGVPREAAAQGLRLV